MAKGGKIQTDILRRAKYQGKIREWDCGCVEGRVLGWLVEKKGLLYIFGGETQQLEGETTEGQSISRKKL